LLYAALQIRFTDRQAEHQRDCKSNEHGWIRLCRSHSTHNHTGLWCDRLGTPARVCASRYSRGNLQTRVEVDELMMDMSAVGLRPGLAGIVLDWAPGYQALFKFVHGEDPGEVAPGFFWMRSGIEMLRF
jgi:hypothetical protein